nr:zinc-regulated transporter 3 [Quercus suber]
MDYDHPQRNRYVSESLQLQTIELTSRLACVVGASIICIDIIVRLFPGQKNFRIQDSDRFLSASLSLSFGVMLFSALYSMLPSAKRSLEAGGFSSAAAAWTLIACFLGGILGIQVISRVMHSFIPSHVVDCEHQHDDSANEHEPSDGQHDSDHTHDHDLEHERSETQQPDKPRQNSLSGHRDHSDSERKRDEAKVRTKSTIGSIRASDDGVADEHLARSANTKGRRRPSLPQRITNSINHLKSNETSDKCDADGPCYGFTDPCGQDCFKSVNAKRGFKGPSKTGAVARPPLGKSLTTQGTNPSESTPLLRSSRTHSHRPKSAQPVSAASETYTDYDVDLEEGPSDSASTAYEPNALHPSKTTSSDDSHQPPADHHHHVPSNAFLSIGLQTSIAIALHKLPEGFITYATNHANPKLGFSVFLALFIHNITEGFAMALPLYLAINNRIKAMLISFVLGGLSQPLGAGVAALWFKIAGNGDWAPSEGVYGGMFAVTAGIMASVALQLFSEALDLTHSRTLCMIGAFTGMGILGISSALTA